MEYCTNGVADVVVEKDCGQEAGDMRHISQMNMSMDMGATTTTTTTTTATTTPIPMVLIVEITIPMVLEMAHRVTWPWRNST